jgi:GTP cyclohydrolase I
MERETKIEAIRAAVSALIRSVEPGNNREGTEDTPDRVAKAWLDYWARGYDMDPRSVLKTFKDGADGCDEMVVVKDIPLYSHCEHHLAPIFGTATVAYIPKKKVVGLSKLSQLVDVYARRLQVQERMTNQIADALMLLDPVGVGVLIKARHLCMESRGVCQQGHHTITCALRGVIKDDGTARAEFMAHAK